MIDEQNAPQQSPSSHSNDPAKAPVAYKSGQWIGFVIGLVITVALIRSCSGDVSSSSIRWQEFSPPDQDFVVQMPGVPARDVQTVRVEGLDVQQLTYSVETEHAFYAVSSAEFPLVMGLSGDALDRVLDSSVEYMLLNSGTELTAQTKVSLDGYPGRQVTAVRAATGQEPAIVIDVLVLLVGDTQYTLLVGRDESHRYSTEKEKFFESFKPRRG